jgi:hypothetical protein
MSCPIAVEAHFLLHPVLEESNLLYMHDLRLKAPALRYNNTQKMRERSAPDPLLEIFMERINVLQEFIEQQYPHPLLQTSIQPYFCHTDGVEWGKEKPTSFTGVVGDEVLCEGVFLPEYLFLAFQGKVLSLAPFRVAFKTLYAPSYDSYEGFLVRAALRSRHRERERERSRTPLE